MKKSIGMAFVDQDLSKEGTKLAAIQRGKKHKIGIVKMPFVQSGYFKGWKDFWFVYLLVISFWIDDRFNWRKIN